MYSAATSVYFMFMAFQMVESNGGDTPLQIGGQPGETSSLGLFWPPKETDFHRAKGFYKRAILSVEDFMPFRQVYDDFAQSPRFTTHGVESGDGEEKNYSRITMRAVVSNEFLMTNVEMLQPMVESILPLGNDGAFAGTSLVYFGTNHPDRQSDQMRMEQCVQNLRVALAEPTRRPDEMIAKASQNGYGLTLVDKTHEYTTADKIALDLFALYKPFGWSQEQVLELLNAQNRLVAVAQKNDTVVSAGIAEMGTEFIQFGPDNSYPLDLVELTDAATLVADEGKGLYSGVSTVLLNELATQYSHSPTEVLVFGESNASALGVLKTSTHQGRIFAASVGEQFGYPGSGMLHQHVPILDRGEKKNEVQYKYNNFYPTFITKGILQNTYGHSTTV